MTTLSRSLRSDRSLVGGVALTLAAAATTLAGADTTVTFDDGPEGWVGPGGPGGATVIEPDGGNPGANLRTVFNNFGITFANDTNAEFAQDFSGYDTVTFSVDTRVDLVNFFGQDVSRPWLIELRDFDSAVGGYPWTSVWFLLDNISEGPGYTTYTVTIEDPTSATLPAGWAGYGAEDPDTFEPILPEGVTFADVLAGVDEVAFTTLQPGFFFGFTDFDVRLDNISVSTTGGPSVDGDVDGDGDVDFSDIVALLAQWGPCAGCSGDFDGDDDVDFEDLLVVLANFM